jgi:putative two-component system response regulator
MEIISKIQNISDKVKDIVMYHHEHWDGSGYPSGLRGEEIPFLARIVTLADIYEALTSDRIYRKAYTKEYTVNYIKENAGKIFDPNLSDKFVEFIGGSDY